MEWFHPLNAIRLDNVMACKKKGLCWIIVYHHQRCKEVGRTQNVPYPKCKQHHFEGILKTVTLPTTTTPRDREKQPIFTFKGGSPKTCSATILVWSTREKWPFLRVVIEKKHTNTPFAAQFVFQHYPWLSKVWPVKFHVDLPFSPCGSRLFTLVPDFLPDIPWRRSRLKFGGTIWSWNFQKLALSKNIRTEQDALNPLVNKGLSELFNSYPFFQTKAISCQSSDCHYKVWHSHFNSINNLCHYSYMAICLPLMFIHMVIWINIYMYSKF